MRISMLHQNQNFSAFEQDKFGESSPTSPAMVTAADFYFPTWKQTQYLLSLVTYWHSMAYLRGQAGIFVVLGESICLTDKPPAGSWLLNTGCSLDFGALREEDVHVSTQRIKVAAQRSRSSWSYEAESVPCTQTGLRCLRSCTHIFQSVRHSLCVAYCLTASSNK